MKRVRRTPMPLLDKLRNNRNAARVPISVNTSDNWKYIRIIFCLVVSICVICFIHIIKETNQVKQANITSTNIAVMTQNSNTQIPEHTHNLIIDNRQELIDTQDVIIKYEETKQKSQTTLTDTLSFTNEDCDTHSECGRCWLHKNLNLAIEISSVIPIPPNKLHSSYKNLNLLTYWITLRSITNNVCIAKDITLYISIKEKTNAESVGGLAVIDNTSLCGWKYKWIVSKPGTYVINAYLLYYRGYADFNQMQCQNEKNIEYIDTSDNGQYTLTRLPQKWRFYGAVEGCCEWCNRMKGKCQAWTSGNGDKKCVLFTESPSLNEHITVSKHNGFISGMSRNEPQQWYLGSLLNIQPNSCHNTHFDLVYGSGMEYDVINEITDNGKNALDILCETNTEMGRWIGITKDIDCENIKEFNSFCWIQTHFGHVPFRWKPYQCHYEQRTVSNIHKCLMDNDVNRIAVGGDSLIRLFSLEIVRYIFGEPFLKGENVPNWEYSKHYSKNEIQAWFMGYDHRIDDITFMKEFIIDSENVNKPNVFIHNFQIIHKIWHQNVTEFRHGMFEHKRMANELFERYYGKQSEGNWPLRMVFEAPLLVSEREYHDTADRAMIYNAIMREVLESDGWIFLPVFELSKARMYDSTNKKDGVVDGMHMSSNILIEIARVTIDMLCRFDFKHHTPANELNSLFMSV